MSMLQPTDQMNQIQICPAAIESKSPTGSTDTFPQSDAVGVSGLARIGNPEGINEWIADS
jgi:hypothetical protein